MAHVPVKGVILDWGGVLIEPPAPELLAWCAGHLAVSPARLQEALPALFEQFQRGTIEEPLLWSEVADRLGVPAPTDPSPWASAFRAVCRPRAGVFALPPFWKSRGLRTALLSNTEAPAAAFFRSQNHPGFDLLVFSCEVGLIKPDPAIFILAASRLELPTHSLLFVDDNPDFAEAARHAGLQALHAPTLPSLFDGLASLGIPLP